MKPQGDHFGRWIGMSLALHVGLFAVTMIWPWLLTVRGDARWGSRSGGDGGINIKIAAGMPGIALPTPPVTQEKAVANESKGLYTSEPEPAPQVKPEPKKAEDKAAVEIPDKSTPKRPQRQPQQIASAPQPPTPANAVPYGKGGAPDLTRGQTSSGSGVAALSFGDGSFGDLYSAYVESMTRRISDNWNKPDIRNLSTSPRVYVSFTIARDGTVNDIDIAQSSGIPELDTSARRAMLRSNPLPPLPDRYRGSNVTVRFYFEYAR
jgi:TonB family protein